MIKIIDNYFSHSDDRGYMQGLINFGPWQEINMISSNEDVIRGGHYHKETSELFIMLLGSVTVEVQLVDKFGRLVGPKEKYKFTKNDVFLIDPMTYHKFNIETRSSWINALSIAMDSKNKDIYSAENE